MRKRVKEEEREREKATDRKCIYIERKNKEKETKKDIDTRMIFPQKQIF